MSVHFVLKIIPFPTYFYRLLFFLVNSFLALNMRGNVLEPYEFTVLLMAKSYEGIVTAYNLAGTVCLIQTLSLGCGLQTIIIINSSFAPRITIGRLLDYNMIFPAKILLSDKS